MLVKGATSCDLKYVIVEHNLEVTFLNNQLNITLSLQWEDLIDGKSTLVHVMACCC